MRSTASNSMNCLLLSAVIFMSTTPKAEHQLLSKYSYILLYVNIVIYLKKVCFMEQTFRPLEHWSYEELVFMLQEVCPIVYQLNQQSIQASLLSSSPVKTHFGGWYSAWKTIRLRTEEKAQPTPTLNGCDRSQPPTVLLYPSFLPPDRKGGSSDQVSNQHFIHLWPLFQLNQYCLCSQFPSFLTLLREWKRVREADGSPKTRLHFGAKDVSFAMRTHNHTNHWVSQFLKA